MPRRRVPGNGHVVHVTMYDEVVIDSYCNFLVISEGLVKKSLKHAKLLQNLCETGFETYFSSYSLTNFDRSKSKSGKIQPFLSNFCSILETFGHGQH